jgi:hypothetical protein
MTRDSKLWPILQVGALAIATLAAVTNPAELGISPVAMRWISLVNVLIGTVGGKFGNSNLKGENDHKRAKRPRR